MEPINMRDKDNELPTWKKKKNREKMKARQLLQSKKMPLVTFQKPKQVAFDSYGQPGSHNGKRAIMDDLYDDTKAESSVMKRVKEVQENLDPQFPTFIKLMIRSNVTVGFLLNFPRTFSELHMPRRDAVFVLVDSSEEEYQTKYLVEKNAFSAGWRAFSIAHKLVLGDVLVFQLIKHSEFKVYIVRTSELDEVDGALALLHLKADTRRCNSENNTGTHWKDKEKKHLEHLPPENAQENEQRDSDIMLDTNPVTNHPANDKIDVCLLLEEIITEAASIATAARARNSILSHPDDFSSQGERLKAFEEVGVNLGSLSAWMDRLSSLALEAKEAVETEKDRRKKSGLVHTEEEKKNLAVKLLKLIEAKIRLGAEIETLKENARRLEAHVPEAS